MKLIGSVIIGQDRMGNLEIRFRRFRQRNHFARPVLVPPYSVGIDLFASCFLLAACVLTNAR